VRIIKTPIIFRVNINSAIVIAATMTSWSIVILAAKSTLVIAGRAAYHRDFTNTCAGKFHEQTVALILSRSLELHYQRINSMKAVA